MADAHIEACFAGLDAIGPLLLAVSGGPDSMALMGLAARWAASLPDPPLLHVATVDHGLRSEAAGEAAFVCKAAAMLGLPHTTLTWRGPKPKTRIQERARAARYALLAAHARAIGVGHVVTAHHADDQAETILMRLGRGSGIGGLAGMARTTPLAPGLVLVRPLLAVPKADLVAFCRAHTLLFLDDPSNSDPRFARARLRADNEALRRLGLDRAALLRLARRMARADVALEAETDRVEALLSPQRDAISYVADLSKLRDASPEILLRLMRRAAAGVVPGAPQRLERLEALTDLMVDALRHCRAHRATFGCARLVLTADAVLSIGPESPRRRGRAASEQRALGSGGAPDRPH